MGRSEKINQKNNQNGWNRATRPNVLTDGVENGGAVSGLVYFTHVVDGHVYGAWYRVISSTQIELIGVGLLEFVSYGGFNPENAAKSNLEQFVRMRARMGAPIPHLESAASNNSSEDGPAQGNTSPPTCQS